MEKTLAPLTPKSLILDCSREQGHNGAFKQLITLTRRIPDLIERLETSSTEVTQPAETPPKPECVHVPTLIGRARDMLKSIAEKVGMSGLFEDIPHISTITETDEGHPKPPPEPPIAYIHFILKGNDSVPHLNIVARYHHQNVNTNTVTDFEITPCKIDTSVPLAHDASPAMSIRKHKWPWVSINTVGTAWLWRPDFHGGQTVDANVITTYPERTITVRSGKPLSDPKSQKLLADAAACAASATHETQSIHDESLIFVSIHNKPIVDTSDPFGGISILNPFFVFRSLTPVSSANK